MVVCLLQGVDVVLLDIILTVPDDILDFLSLLERVNESGQEMGIEEDGFGLGRYQGVLQSFFAESVVGCHNRH